MGTDNGKFVTQTQKEFTPGAPSASIYENYKFANMILILSAYDGMLNDDTFTFTIPAPLIVRAETFELKIRDRYRQVMRNS